MFRGLKTYVGLTSLAVAAGIMAVPVMQAARQDISISTHGFPKVDWLDGKNFKEPCGTAQEHEEALLKLKKDPIWPLIPKELQKAIEQNKDNYSYKNKNMFFIANSNIQVCNMGLMNNYYNVLPCKWAYITFLDAPEKTSAVDPKTGKYYVMPPKKTWDKLPPEDMAYIKKLTERVNQNIHYLGNSPIPKIDEKKMKKGAYLFAGMQPLRLVNPSRMNYNQKKFLTYYKNYYDKTEADLRAFFNLEDETDYQLACRLGMPVYHPEQWVPDEELSITQNCYALPSENVRPIISAPILFGSSAYLTNPKHAYAKTYIPYFQAIQLSAQMFRKGLQEELAQTGLKEAKYTAVKAIITQADKFASQIEQDATRYMLQKDIYKKPPRSILEPSGRNLEKFLLKQKQRAAQERQRD